MGLFKTSPALRYSKQLGDERLFDLLKRGYIDARYKDHYEITAEELSVLIERVVIYKQ